MTLPIILTDVINLEGMILVSYSAQIDPFNVHMFVSHNDSIFHSNRHFSNNI